jgi:hypothetical protein
VDDLSLSKLDLPKETFDRELSSPASLRVPNRPSLESDAYAHIAADLHVRPVSRTALVRDRGRRERFKKYTLARREQRN